VSALFLEAVGLVAPGLPSWDSGRAVLAVERPFELQAMPAVQPATLPPNERRRAPLGVRLALHAAGQASAGAAPAAAELATVFATSDADMDVVHRLCVALAEDHPGVSPTDFHNSVHNAASGYWSIGAGARGASTTLSAHDFTFAAGLREAFAQAIVDDVDVLLVAFDVAPPPPLLAARPVPHSAALALWLCRRATDRALARLTLAGPLPCAEPEAAMQDGDLEALRRSNPALRGLPLLRAIARRETALVYLPVQVGRTLAVQVEPR
jgi:hypothetical protein